VQYAWFAARYATGYTAVTIALSNTVIQYGATETSKEKSTFLGEKSSFLPVNGWYIGIINAHMLLSCSHEEAFSSAKIIGVRAKGLEGEAARSESGKANIFRAKAKFFGQKPAAKNEKNVFIKRQKNGIHSVQQNEVPEIRNWGWSGKAILQVIIAVFSDTVEIFFPSKMAQPPRKNWPARVWPRLKIKITRSSAIAVIADRTACRSTIG